MDDKINQAIDALADQKTAALRETNGKTCPNCGMMQGKLRFFLKKLRFIRTYCHHTIQCIDLKYKDEFVRIIRMAHNG